jgi:hypothetical protein
MKMIDTDHYILDDNHRVVKTDDLLVWGRFMSNRKRRVDLTCVGNAEISTVFLGLNHRYSDKGPPLLFETMIFGGKHDEYCKRYSSWDDAMIGHDMAVKMVKASVEVC